MSSTGVRSASPRRRGLLWWASTLVIIALVVVFALPGPRAVVGGLSPFATALAPGTPLATSIDGTAVDGPALAVRPGIPVVLGDDEPAALREAVADLLGDLRKVLGQASPLSTSTGELQRGQSAVVVTYRGSGTASLRDPTLDGEEAHQVSTRTVGDATHVVVQGADLRGSLYAVYTFSSRFLGVPPLWHWMHWQPRASSSIAVPADAGVRVGVPQVRHRAWFLNNQDLWLGWEPPAGVDRYDLLFETMLRLKLNTWYIGEQLGEYGGGWLEKARAANARGLVVAANGLATFRQWDRYWTATRGLRTPPRLSLANSRLFQDYWEHSLRHGVAERLDVLWVLGFRGKADGGFWNDMPDAPATDAARGDVIETQVRRQIELVRRVTRQQHPSMALLLWNELSTLLDGGSLQLPVDGDLMWLFGNEVRDHYPGSGARTYPLPADQPIGYYMNLQFYSTGAHLAEAEGLWKLHQGFDVVEHRRPGSRIGMGLVNVGNVREFLLTASAGAEMLWNIGNYEPDAGGGGRRLPARAPT